MTPPPPFGLVIVLDGGPRLGIVAKRPRAERSVRVLVRQAGKQLAAAGLTGLVALNLDALAPAAHGPARGGPQRLALMHSTLTRSLPAILAGASGLPLLATLLSITLPCALPETLELGSSTATQVRVIAWPTPSTDRRPHAPAHRPGAEPRSCVRPHRKPPNAIPPSTGHLSCRTENRAHLAPVSSAGLRALPARLGGCKFALR